MIFAAFRTKLHIAGLVVRQDVEEVLIKSGRIVAWHRQDADPGNHSFDLSRSRFFRLTQSRQIWLSVQARSRSSQVGFTVFRARNTCLGLIHPLRAAGETQHEY